MSIAGLVSHLYQPVSDAFSRVCAIAPDMQKAKVMETLEEVVEKSGQYAATALLILMPIVSISAPFWLI